MTRWMESFAANAIFGYISWYIETATYTTDTVPLSFSSHQFEVEELGLNTRALSPSFLSKTHLSYV